MVIKLLESRNITVGVTGSIACYKTVDLCSKLTQAGALVDVILSDSAKKFVNELTFHSVTGRPVYWDMWTMDEHIHHVKLGESADLLIIAPATAHTIAKLAHGLADNLLTVTALAARCPMLVAPAMDGGMYLNKATQANLSTLRQRGIIVVGPAEGRMASGLIGAGRMLEPGELMGHIRLVLAQQGPLHGRHVVVTAGPTQEPLDPVRFLSNRSSGKQGIALAQAALDAGARVTLISGPMNETPPLGVNHVPTRTARQMQEAVLASIIETDVLLMAAAVSDFRPADVADHKIKKSGIGDSQLNIPLARNPDILDAIKDQKAVSGRPLLAVGFAAETQDILNHGRDKLMRKGLDLIAINDVSSEDAGFGTDTNKVILLSIDGLKEELPLQSKTEVAQRVVETIVRMLDRE